MPIDYTGDLQPVRKYTRKRKEVSVEDQIRTLQSLGFKVQPPSTSTDIKVHEESVNLLGITDESYTLKKKKKKVPVDTKLRGTLYFAHHISGATYGPGPLELDITERDLFASLLKEDQTCLQHFQEPMLPQGNRCYIVQKSSLIARNTYRKTEVSEAQFNSAALWDGFITESAGAYDCSRQGIPVPQHVGYHIANNNSF